jgi:hypothetical protein
MRVNCDDCKMQHTSHCDDCLVTALLHPPEGSVEIPDELGTSLGALSGQGLVPVLRFRPREPDDVRMASDSIGPSERRDPDEDTEDGRSQTA